MSTFTATPVPDARPPYMELKWATGSTTTKVYSASITRDGQPVRIPASVTPTSTAVWRDYDAPYDNNVLYVATVGSSTAPTGVSNEPWTTAPTGNGWTSVQNISTTARVVRTNRALNPSFETNATTGVAASGAVTLSRSTTEHYLGSASLAVTAQPIVITNYVTDPLFQSGTSGWAIGSNATTLVNAGSRLRVSGNTTTSGGNVYANSPAYPVVAGTTYYMGVTTTRGNPALAGPSGAMGLMYRWYNSVGTQIGADRQTSATINQHGSHTFTMSESAPTGATTMRLFPYAAKARFLNPGGGPGGLDSYYYTIDFDINNAWVTNGNAGLFYGSSPDTATYQYDWTGATNASTSTRKQAVTNAGARINFTGITPGRMVAFSYYAKMSAGSSTTSADPSWSTTTSPSLGTVDTTWQRFSTVVVAPATAAADGYIDIKVGALGFGGTTFYIDNILVEVSDVVKPYFDGTVTEIPSSSPLGTWVPAWTGSAGITMSTVSFDRTIGSSATPTSGWSLTKNFSFLSSSLRFLGFVVPSGGSALVTVMFGSAHIDIVVAATQSGYNYSITNGSTNASMSHEAQFTGEIDLAFLDGRAYLNHLDSGASVSIPYTASTTVTSVSIVLTTNTVMLPFQMVPGLILTTQTLQDSDMLSPTSAWLIHPYNPSASVEVDAGQGCSDVFATAESAVELTRPANTSLLAPIGSKRMLAITLGSRKDPSWEMEVSTKSVASYDAMVDLLEDSAPLRFDYPDVLGSSAALCNRGMRIPKGWFSVGDVTEARDGANWASPARRWALPLSPVSAPTAYPVD